MYFVVVTGSIDSDSNYVPAGFNSTGYGKAMAVDFNGCLVCQRRDVDVGQR